MLHSTTHHRRDVIKCAHVYRGHVKAHAKNGHVNAQVHRNDDRSPAEWASKLSNLKEK